MDIARALYNFINDFTHFAVSQFFSDTYSLVQAQEIKRFCFQQECLY